MVVELPKDSLPKRKSPEYYVRLENAPISDFSIIHALCDAHAFIPQMRKLLETSSGTNKPQPDFLLDNWTWQFLCNTLGCISPNQPRMTSHIGFGDSQDELFNTNFEELKQSMPPALVAFGIVEKLTKYDINFTAAQAAMVRSEKPFFVQERSSGDFTCTFRYKERTFSFVFDSITDIESSKSDLLTSKIIEEMMSEMMSEVSSGKCDDLDRYFGDETQFSDVQLRTFLVDSLNTRMMQAYVSNNGSINDKFCFLDYPIIS